MRQITDAHVAQPPPAVSVLLLILRMMSGEPPRLWLGLPVNVEHRHSCLCRLVFIFKLLNQRPSAQISGKRCFLSAIRPVCTPPVSGYPPPYFLPTPRETKGLAPTGPWATQGPPSHSAPGLRLLDLDFYPISHSHELPRLELAKSQSPMASFQNLRMLPQIVKKSMDKKCQCPRSSGYTVPIIQRVQSTTIKICIRARL